MNKKPMKYQIIILNIIYKKIKLINYYKKIIN